MTRKLRRDLARATKREGEYRAALARILTATEEHSPLDDQTRERAILLCWYARRVAQTALEAEQIAHLTSAREIEEWFTNDRRPYGAGPGVITGPVARDTRAARLGRWWRRRSPLRAWMNMLG